MNIPLMTFRLKNVLLVGVLLGLLPAARAGTRSGQRQPFDVGWKFNPADSPDAQSVSFDDTAWRPVELPHDWSIEGASSATDRTGGEVLGEADTRLWRLQNLPLAPLLSALQHGVSMNASENKLSLHRAASMKWRRGKQEIN